MRGQTSFYSDFSVWRDFISAARDTGYAGQLLAIAEEIDTAPCARLLSLGVSGVFMGYESPASLVQAIRVVASGGAWVEQSMIRLLAVTGIRTMRICASTLSRAASRQCFGAFSAV